MKCTSYELNHQGSFITVVFLCITISFIKYLIVSSNTWTSFLYNLLIKASVPEKFASWVVGACFGTIFKRHCLLLCLTQRKNCVIFIHFRVAKIFLWLTLCAVSFFLVYLFHDEDPYHIETSPLIYRANQPTGFYMAGTTVIKEFSKSEEILPGS